MANLDNILQKHNQVMASLSVGGLSAEEKTQLDIKKMRLKTKLIGLYLQDFFDKNQELTREKKAEIILVVSAAGVGCPVIASIQGSDYIIAITEPTPSALNDLKRALRTVEHFRIPYGIVINKYDLYKAFSKKIEKFAKKYKIPILGKIPYDKEFVNALVDLKPISTYNMEYAKLFSEILDKSLEKLKET